MSTNKVKWQINDDVLEFEEETHKYTLNGEEVESVTHYIATEIFPDKYSGIDPEVLNRAARYGSEIHQAVENYEIFGIEDGSNEVKFWKAIKNFYKIECLENELPIIIRLKDRTLVGRLDMIIKIGDKIGVADIKTTYKLDTEYLMWQLSLYALGYEQSYGKKIEFLRGVWLRRDNFKLAEIPFLSIGM